MTRNSVVIGDVSRSIRIESTRLLPFVRQPGITTAVDNLTAARQFRVGRDSIQRWIRTGARLLDIDDVLRRHAMHQTASAPCSATAGHVRIPTSLAQAPALARTPTATVLYSSMAATTPGTARFGSSLRASQQAQPNESTTAPVIRATTSAAGASSDAPSKNATTSAGDTNSINPVVA